MLSAFRNIPDYVICPFLQLVFLLLSVGNADAQESPIPSLPTDGVLDIAQIEAAKESINARDDLSEETRAQVVDALREAESYGFFSWSSPVHSKPNENCC